MTGVTVRTALALAGIWVLGLVRRPAERWQRALIRWAGWAELLDAAEQARRWEGEE